MEKFFEIGNRVKITHPHYLGFEGIVIGSSSSGILTSIVSISGISGGTYTFANCYLELIERKPTVAFKKGDKVRVVKNCITCPSYPSSYRKVVGEIVRMEYCSGTGKTRIGVADVSGYEWAFYDCELELIEKAKETPKEENKFKVGDDIIVKSGILYNSACNYENMKGTIFEIIERDSGSASLHRVRFDNEKDFDFYDDEIELAPVIKKQERANPKFKIGDKVVIIGGKRLPEYGKKFIGKTGVVNGENEGVKYEYTTVLFENEEYGFLDEELELAPKEKATKFKIDDFVKINVPSSTYHNAVGKIVRFNNSVRSYTVALKTKSSDQFLTFGENELYLSDRYEFERFLNISEQIDLNKKNAPKFKVGDTVRVLSDLKALLKDGCIGNLKVVIGKIVKIHPYTIEVEFKDYPNHYIFEKNIELVEDLNKFKRYDITIQGNGLFTHAISVGNDSSKAFKIAINGKEYETSIEKLENFLKGQ